MIIAGGIGLSRSSDLVSRRTGLGQALGGALLLATATSLPDLVVAISAARKGWVDLAVGDLVGAALMNLLVLGVLDLSHQSRGRMLSRMAAAHAISGMMCIALLSWVGMSVFLPSEVLLDRTIGGIGLGLWAVVAIYLLGLRLVLFDKRLAARAAPRDPEDAPEPSEDRGRRLLLPILGYLGSAAAIFFAAPSLANAAADLAERTGLGNTLVGTALLPVTTTLPELVVGITAIRMRAFPMVVGNAFGSISFNLMLLAPVDLAYSGSLMADAASTHVITCFAGILVVGVAVMGQLYHGEKRIRFVEPDALLIIVLVFGALGMIYFIR